MSKLFAVNVERCIACGKCELACSFAHAQEGKPARSRITIYRRGPELGTPVVCFQCHDAACVAICPTQALERDPGTGAIMMLRHRCITCRMCVAACPFGNMLWDETHHCVQKCDLCGGDPRCVPFCPTGALQWADATDVVRAPQPSELRQPPPDKG